MSKKDLTGQRFTRLVVIKKIGIKKVGAKQNSVTLWLCQCDCGNTKEAVTSALTSKHTQSCGCLPTHHPKHGHSDTRFYMVWRSMRRRTEEKSAEKFPNYAGRGIKVCERWQEFENFYKDMFSSYRSGLTLDRIDNEGDYEPGNCRWISVSEQNRNRRNNLLYTINGQTKCLADWCKDYNIDSSTVQNRIKKGWDIKKAFETPPLPRYTNNFNPT